MAPQKGTRPKGGGVKGRSGPPGNLNAAKHGITTWLRRRALPREKQHIVKMVEIYKQAIITAKGGPEAITEVEMALVENAAIARGVILLALEEAKARGLVKVSDGSWDFAPGVNRLGTFLNAERSALALLGLGRRQKLVPSIVDLMKQEAQQAEGSRG